MHARRHGVAVCAPVEPCEGVTVRSKGRGSSAWQAQKWSGVAHRVSHHPVDESGAAVPIKASDSGRH